MSSSEPVRPWSRCDRAEDLEPPLIEWKAPQLPQVGAFQFQTMCATPARLPVLYPGRPGPTCAGGHTQPS